MPMIAWKLYYTVFCIDAKNCFSSSILLQIHWCSKVSERRWISLWHVQVSSGGTQVASEPTIALETSKEEKYVLMASNQPSLDLPSCRHIVFWPIERSNKYVYSLGGQEVKIRGQNHKLLECPSATQYDSISMQFLFIWNLTWWSAGTELKLTIYPNFQVWLTTPSFEIWSQCNSSSDDLPQENLPLVQNLQRWKQWSK